MEGQREGSKDLGSDLVDLAINDDIFYLKPSLIKMSFSEAGFKKIGQISRAQLESHLYLKTKELLNANDKIAELQKSVSELQKEVKSWKVKSDSLAKSCSNVGNLLKVQLAAATNKEKPKKLVQSVGVQVKLDSGGKQTVTKRKLEFLEDTANKKRSNNNVSQQIGKQQVKKQNQSQEIFETKQISDHSQLSKSESGLKLKDQSSLLKTNVDPKTLDSMPPPLPHSTDVVHEEQPQPHLRLTQTTAGLEVYWEFRDSEPAVLATKIQSYELFAYQGSKKSNAAWRKVGDIKSIKLPIRCTLSQFKSGSTYFFAVRAKNLQGLLGPFSDVQKISLE